MRSIPAAIAALCLFAMPAKASEPETGAGVFCNTRPQIERLAEKLDELKSAPAAIKSVNDEAGPDEVVCRYITITAHIGPAQGHLMMTGAPHGVHPFLVLSVALLGQVIPFSEPVTWWGLIPAKAGAQREA